MKIVETSTVFFYRLRMFLELHMNSTEMVKNVAKMVIWTKRGQTKLYGQMTKREPM